MLFNRAIELSQKTDVIEDRLAILIDNITKMIYTNVSRGLFEKDKVIFSFLICSSILRNAKEIDEAVWNIFLRGPTIFTPEEKASMLDSPDLQICSQLLWENLVSAELRSKGQFEGITQHVT